MSETGITFAFDGITHCLNRCKVSIYDHLSGEKFQTFVSLDDSELSDNRGLRLDSVAADLMDLAVAIDHADRWMSRSESSDCTRKIHVRLPVINIDLFESPEFLVLLKDALGWFTADNWTFHFVHNKQRIRFSNRKLPLWTESNRDTPTEVALWSGGLDAFAGLCNRIRQESAERYLMLSAGANMPIRGVQKTVFRCLRKRMGTDLQLTQLHIFQKDTRQHGLRRNDKLRARAAVYLLLGSAYAYLEGQDKLFLFENGPGALNLPYRLSEVGVDHARSVHPISLSYISDIVSKVLRRPFKIHNPFIGWTKAEMCEVLKELGISDVAWRTWSCDRARGTNFVQCGRCSSCILRRQGFLVARIGDCTLYRLDRVSNSEREKLLSESHLLHMLCQAKSLRNILQTENAWDVLALKHPTLLGQITHFLPEDKNRCGPSLREAIVSMLSRYADEWHDPRTIKYFGEEIKETRIAQGFR